MHTEDDSTPNEEKQVLIYREPTSEELITAMMIGDGYSRGRKNKYLEFCHCMRQADYAEWKFKLLVKYVHFNTGLTIQNMKNLRQRVRVTTPAFPAVTAVYNKLYISGQKQMSQEVLNILTPLGVAIWFMDDGNAVWQKKDKRGNILTVPRLRSIQLNTHCFSLQEHELIVEWFQQSFNIFFRITAETRRCQYFLRAGIKEDVARFIELVKPYVLQIPCMSYKIGL